jgi:NADH-quinone oxidoreductase subunit L
MWFLENAWLVPAIPAVGFFVILLFGKRLPMKGAEVGIATLGSSLVFSLGAAAQWIQRVSDAEGGEHGLGLVSAFGRSLATPMAAAQEGEHHVAPFVAPVIKQWNWWQSGGVDFTLGIHVDGLAVAILVVVSLITTLILIYSIEYMRDDRRFTHFYAAMTLFAAGMLAMVVAESTVQFLLGWEIMGLCSFILIGHWWEELPNAKAAVKAFLTVRTGDIGMLVGLAMLFFSVNPWARENLGQSGFSIAAIQAWALSGDGSSTLLFWISMALLLAVIGKSGQFPLHTWLPDAMAGPTPVSALLHSSTMVVAGVYLAARFYPVFYEGFSIADGVWNPLALIGGITIVIAALLAFVQVDIKKVLAYSTVSQLGYMVMGLGVGAWTPAVFHIFTHAWFKALLFLGAGSVSHSGSHHSFDMKADMGGLRKHMPITFVTFIIGTLALAGIFPLAGFWSKDEILANAGENDYRWFMIVGLIGAFMTAAYMARCVYLTFFGEYRGGHDGEHDEAHELEPSPVFATASVGAAVNPALHGGGHDDHGGHHAGPHESNKLITVPLIILAALACVAGFLNAPAKPFEIEKFTEWVEPSSAPVAVGLLREVPGVEHIETLPAEAGAEETHDETALASGEARIFPAEVTHAPFEWGAAMLSVAIAAAGLVIGFLMSQAIYTQHRFAGLTQRSRLLGAGYTFLWNKYYLDDLYEKVIMRGIRDPIAKAAYWIDQNLIDGIVNGAGIGARVTGQWVYRNIDQGLVDGAVNGSGAAAEESGGILRLITSGRISQYGALLFGAAAVGALVLVLTV